MHNSSGPADAGTVGSAVSLDIQRVQVMDFLDRRRNPVDVMRQFWDDLKALMVIMLDVPKKAISLQQRFSPGINVFKVVQFRRMGSAKRGDEIIAPFEEHDDVGLFGWVEFTDRLNQSFQALEEAF